MNTRYQRLSVQGRRLEAAAVAGAVLLTIVLLRMVPAEGAAGAWDGCGEQGHSLTVADWRPETVQAAHVDAVTAVVTQAVTDAVIRRADPRCGR